MARKAATRKTASIEDEGKSKTKEKAGEPIKKGRGAKKKTSVTKHTKKNQVMIEEEVRKPRGQIKKERMEQHLKEMEQSKKSQVNFRTKDRASELKFSCSEIVVVAEDLHATQHHEKYLVGRLQEDIWMGSIGDVVISWFNYNSDTKVWDLEDAEDQIPVGSVVCSINKFALESVDEENYEILQIPNETAAFEYADKKLAQQLEEDYNSDDDSQFGDDAVSKRLAHSSIPVAIKKEKVGAIKMEEDGGDDDKGAKKKRKRSSGGGAQKKARGSKGLTPRPNLEGAIEEDIFLIKTGKIASFDGDIERTSKEVVRAVRSGDMKALKACLKSKNIANVFHFQSVALPFSPMIWAIAQGNKEMVDLFLQELKNENKLERVKFQSCSLPTLSTGEISGRHANYNRRKVGASRGGREGNNALLYDTNGDSYKLNSLHVRDDCFPNGIGKYMEGGFFYDLDRDFDEVSKEVYDLAEVKYNRNLMNHNSLDEMVRAGHRKGVERIIKAKLEHTYHANEFNFLHLESLGDEAAKEATDPSKNPFSKDILARSVIKKSQSVAQFTPLCCACINPNVIFLEALLKAAPEHVHSTDAKETSLVHYAAACEGSAPLSYLLDTHGLSRTSLNKMKETPLHYAARSARPKNIQVLLKDVEDEQKKSMLAAKSAFGYYAIHYATQSFRKDRIATVQVLIDAGADVNFSATGARNKLMPVHIAAAKGDLEMLKLLVKHGGNIVKGDKLGRTPLIHACISGHAHVVSYLLIEGVRVEISDSSNNLPIHYAAAYGWLECVKLLQAAGADPDAKNSWKTSPLSVAVQKGRHQISSHLLKLPEVDVNFKDDDGKTLFTKLAEAYISTTLKTSEEDGSNIEAIRRELPHDLQKLLERGDLDVTVTDSNGRNLLHVLSALGTLSSGDKTEQRAVALAKLVVEVAEKNKEKVASFDIDVRDAEGMSPILLAAVNGNFLLFEYLLEIGAKLDETIVDKKGKNVCHHLIGAKPHDCKDQLAFVEKVVGKETYLQMLSTPDNLGFNAVHRALVFSIENLSDQSDFDTAMHLLKDIVTKNIELASIKVGETKCFSDPNQLSEIIVSTYEEDGDEQRRHGFRNRYRGNNHHDSEVEKDAAKILSGDDRVSPQKIKEALSAWKTAVPVNSTAHGKSLIHLACELKYPERMEAVFEWLIPLSRNVIMDRGGGYPDGKTPLEILMCDRVPGELLSRVSSDKRHDLLVKLLGCIELLGDECLAKVNDDAQCLFKSDEERVEHQQSYTKEMDEEFVKTIKRLATSYNKMKTKNAEAATEGSDNMDTDDMDNVGQELVNVFRDTMTKRLVLIKAESTSKGVVSEPTATMFARCGSDSVPVEIWKLLIAKFKLDVERIDSNGDSALHISLRQQDEPLSKYLCEANHGLMLCSGNKDNERPIHVAAKSDNPKLVRMVLDGVPNERIEVNEVDKYGRTAYHYSVEMAAKRAGEHLDPCEIIFLRAGARLDIADMENQRTPLHFAFLENASVDHFDFPHCLSNDQHDRVDLVSSLLASNGATEAVKLVDKQGRTPLFYAAAYNSTVSSLLLVSKGAGLFDTDQDGNTPVNIAILRGHDSYAITMLKSLPEIPELVNIADVRRTREKAGESEEMEIVITSNSKHSIVWHAIKRNFRGLVYLLLDANFSLYQASVDAIELGAFELVRKLFQTSPSDVLQRISPETGYSLLHCTVAVKHFANAGWGTALAELLLSSKVSPSQLGKDGQSALHIAAGNGHEDLVIKLANTDKAMLSMKDNDGHLPLGRFMRFLPSLSQTQSQDSCINILDSLTPDKSIMDDADFNSVPKSKIEKTELLYEPNSLKGEPNTKLVLEEIEKRRNQGKKDPSEKDSSSDIVEGHSTLVIQSLKAKKYEFAQELIKRGALIEMADSDGFNGLHHAVLKSDLESAQLLLRNGANVDAKSENEQSVTPIAIAVIVKAGQEKPSSASHEMIKLLIQYGADVSIVCGLMKATPLHFAILENDVGLVKLLLRAAQHSSCKMSSNKKFSRPNRLVLVRFKGDCALYHGKILKDSVQVFAPTKCLVPLERIAECFSAAGLNLDSLKGLQAMEIITKEQEEAPQKRSSLGRPAWSSGRPAWSSGRDRLCDDSGLDKKADGNSNAMIAELENEEEHEAEEEDKESGLDPNHEPISEEILKKFYGVEALLVGAANKNLTTPIPEGSNVIVQLPTDDSENYYARTKRVWLEGQIIKQWKNGTYNIDIFRGSLATDVPRQLIRPWKGKLSWPKVDSKASDTVKKLLSAKDHDGRTAMQLVVKPVAHGSYENIVLVEELVKYGAAIQMEHARPGSKFAKHLATISNDDLVMDHVDIDQNCTSDFLPGLEPISSSELEKASRNALITLEKRGILKQKKSPPEVLPICEMKAAGRRVLPVDTTDEKFFDIVMAKVETSHYGNRYSENKYYKMQIVENPAKCLFVLVTNWGIVGDYGGQKQETPFSSRAEAEKEFTKIFKSKSGNLWEDLLAGRFEPKVGKYKPVKILPKNFEKPDLPDIAKIACSDRDIEEYKDVIRESALPPDLSETMKAFVDPKALSSAAKHLGLQQERLPLGIVSIEMVLKAEEQLHRIEETIGLIGKEEDLEKKRKLQDDVAVLSSGFYEMLPTKEGDKVLAPLDRQTLKQEREHIASLKDLTVAAQIIKTAAVVSDKVNPLDYSYRALNATMKPVDENNPERLGVEQYFRNTANDGDLVINQVYHLRRHDEKSNKSMENHRLLWHGTHVCNMMGVIKEGLRVAPSTAQIAGNAFGEGVYFSDMVSKSWHYCRASFDSNAKVMPKAYMLLADVALGKQDKVTLPNWGETPAAPDVDSVWAIGYEGPDTERDFVFSEQGTVFPLGPVRRTRTFEQRSTWMKKERWYSSELPKETVDAIETARTNRDSEFPVTVRTQDSDKKPVDVTLLHGKGSKEATVRPVREEKKDGENEDDTNDDNDLSKKEYKVTRSTKELSAHIQHNEYVVMDTDRINLRYIVEVTSRQWLENQTKKKK